MKKEKRRRERRKRSIEQPKFSPNLQVFKRGMRKKVSQRS
jgi:hypothetical protein